MDLLKYIGIGSSLAFAAAVQPGPLQAYLFARVTSIGWRRTLPASLAPLISDGPIALLALLVLGRLSTTMQHLLRAAGGFLLIYLAWNVFRQARKQNNGPSPSDDRMPRTAFEAALVNLLNPSPYLGWALVMGPIVISAWRDSPGLGVAVIAAFYITMICMLALLILLFGSARLLSGRLQNGLSMISMLILAGIGIYNLVISVLYFI